MSTYTDQTLQSNESVEYQAKLSWWSLQRWILMSILSALLTLVTLLPLLSGNITDYSVAPTLKLLFFTACCVALTFRRYMTTEIIITNQRILVATGMFSTTTVELQLPNAEGVEVNQSFLGSALNFGTVTIAGRGATRVDVLGIKDPFNFRRKLSEIQTKYAG